MPMAPRVGFEPTTLRLTAGCSAVELPRNIRLRLNAQVVIIPEPFGLAIPKCAGSRNFSRTQRRRALPPAVAGEASGRQAWRCLRRWWMAMGKGAAAPGGGCSAGRPSRHFFGDSRMYRGPLAVESGRCPAKGQVGILHCRVRVRAMSGIGEKVAGSPDCGGMWAACPATGRLSAACSAKRLLAKGGHLG